MIKKLFSILTVAAITLCTVCTTYSTGMKVTAKEREEVLSQRSEYTKVFDNGNSTYTAYSNTAPIHYQNNDGEWDEIDNTLVEEIDGYYRNKSNSFEILLPSEYSIGDKENYLTVIKADGFELSSYIKGLNNPEGSTEYKESQININNDEKGSIEELNMPYSMEKALNKATSSANYSSISDDLDFYVSVHNASISEALIANAFEAVPESITYSYPKNDILIERSEDNRILFIKDDEVRYVLSPPTIIDSSEEINVIEVDYDLVETDEDYELILYPLSSISSPEGLLAPLSIGAEYSYDRPYSTVYNSHNSPNSVYDNNYIKIGNEPNNEFHTIGSVLEDYSLYSSYATILDSKFYMYVTSLSTYNNPQPRINAYSNNVALSMPNWTDTTPINSNYTIINGISADAGIPGPSVVTTGWNGINLTKLTQSCLNYKNTNSIVGIANNGFTFTLESNSNSSWATATAYSESASVNQPVLTVTFSVNIAAYSLDYSPIKYNDITNYPGSVFNFQNRMNCYAYALQMYCYNTSTYNQLNPGEIGLSQQIANQQFTDITTFGALKNAYKNWLQYSSLHNNCTLESFITEQMKKDAQAMGCSVTELSFSSTTGLNNYVNNSFNESNGRVIALASTTGWTGNAKIHYYLRNGNGTCDNPNHGSKCSVWSDKFDCQSVSGGSTNCDQNICLVINDTSSNYYCGSPTFYFITKEANVYNSWYYFNHNDNNTGTQFVYNT